MSKRRPKVATLANDNVMRSREIVANTDKSFRPTSASHSYWRPSNGSGP
jgi:hypothetical protein